MDTMAIASADAQAALRRKERLGRAASYRILSERVGNVSAKTIHVVLNENESGMEINRERVLRDVNAALDQLEAEYEAETP